MALEWDEFAMLPSCLVVAFPSVYKTPEGAYRDSDFELTEVDAPIQATGNFSATYSLRAYIQHKHKGEPSGTSRSSGHYVAHLKNANVWYTADDSAIILYHNII